MNYENFRTWLNGAELIGRRIVPGLLEREGQFGFKSWDLWNAGIDVMDLLARLGPGWSAYEGSAVWDVIFVRSIPAERAISQIRQTIGRETPLSRMPI